MPTNESTHSRNSAQSKNEHQTAIGITHVDYNGIWIENTNPPAGNTIDWTEVFRLIDQNDREQFIEAVLN